MNEERLPREKDSLMKRTWKISLLVAFTAVLVVILARQVSAYVERMYALQEVFDESSNICVGKVESVDTAKKQFVVKMERDLKGTNPYSKIQVNTNTSLPQFIPYMMAKIKPGQTVLVFYKKEGSSLACLCYMDNFWFQIYGEHMADAGKMWWRQTHIEIRFNRTWVKSVNELVNIIPDILAGKLKAPPPDPNIRPFDVNLELSKIPGASKAGAGQPSVGKIFGRYVGLPHGPGDARGATWVDFDGDGDLDAYCCCQNGNEMFQCELGGMFLNVTKDVGLSGASQTAAWADYNGDGKPDLLLPTPKLFTNLGGKFRDDTALLSKATGADTEACTWIDYNGDGLPDILFPNGEKGIMVFRNTGKDGAERFVDAGAEAGLGPNGPGRAKGTFVSVVDFDGDGFSDFLYNAGEGMLFRNNGQGKFEEVKTSGIKFNSTDGNKIGVAWGDYNNDGAVDLVVPQNNIIKLFRNNNDGTFADVSAQAGDLAKVPGAWTAAAWGDVDRDGLLDLYVGKGDGDGRLFLSKGDGTFVNMVEPLGLYHLLGNARVFGVALADFDGDGDLDILANSAEGCSTVFVNDYNQEDPKRVFLAVRPKGTKGVVGSIVRLFDDQGKLMGLRELAVAQNAGSQADATAFFGLASGKYKVSLCTSDGGFGERAIEVGNRGLAVEVAAEVK
jgi:hypothetical protein